MRSRVGLFGASLLLTLSLLLPMLAAAAFFVDQRQQQRDLRQAAGAQSGVPVEQGAQSVHRLLLAVQGDVPQFFLLRADAPAHTLTLCALPSDLLVQAPAGQTTLADCYMAAGPARAAQLLTATLGAGPQAYFAATADTWRTFADEDASFEVNTAPLLSEELRRELDLTAPMLTLTAGQLGGLIARAQTAGADAPALRAALWAALLRQNPDTLTGLAEAARQASARTLTDLTATDLHELEQTLCWLALRPDLTVTAPALPTARTPGGTALTEEGKEQARALLS